MSRIIFLGLCLAGTVSMASTKDDLRQACLKHGETIQKRKTTNKDRLMCECLAAKIDKDSSLNTQDKGQMSEKWADTMAAKNTKDGQEKEYQKRVMAHMKALNQCAAESGGWNK